MAKSIGNDIFAGPTAQTLHHGASTSPHSRYVWKCTVSAGSDADTSNCVSVPPKHRFQADAVATPVQRQPGLDTARHCMEYHHTHQHSPGRAWRGRTRSGSLSTVLPSVGSQLRHSRNTQVSAVTEAQRAVSRGRMTNTYHRHTVPAIRQRHRGAAV